MRSHCVKSVQIRSFFWSVFSCIRTEYGKILRISPYSARMRGTTDQKKLRTWALFRQCQWWYFWCLYLYFSVWSLVIALVTVLFIFLFYASRHLFVQRPMCQIFSKLAVKLLTSSWFFLLSSLNIFHTSLCCFHIWLWASKYLVRIT